MKASEWKRKYTHKGIYRPDVDAIIADLAVCERERDEWSTVRECEEIQRGKVLDASFSYAMRAARDRDTLRADLDREKSESDEAVRVLRERLAKAREELEDLLAYRRMIGVVIMGTLVHSTLFFGEGEDLNTLKALIARIEARRSK